MQPTLWKGLEGAVARATQWPLCRAGCGLRRTGYVLTLGLALHTTCSEMSAQPLPEPASTHLSPPCKCECYSQPRLLDAGHEQRGGICAQPTHLLSSPASRVQWEHSLCGGAAQPGPSHSRASGGGRGGWRSCLHPPASLGPSKGLTGGGHGNPQSAACWPLMSPPPGSLP